MPRTGDRRDRRCPHISRSTSYARIRGPPRATLPSQIRRTSPAPATPARRSARTRLLDARSSPTPRAARTPEQSGNYAEWLGSWTVVLAGSINHLRTLGDTAAVDEFQQIRLTRRGIARR
jgi:hypothetical protein